MFRHSKSVASPVATASSSSTIRTRSTIRHSLIDRSSLRGRHSLLLHAGFLDQNFEPAAIEDLRYDTRQLVYSYTRGQHAIAVEWGQERREPENSRETDWQRFALRYRLTFNESL
jgi:hypothetical protein